MDRRTAIVFGTILAALSLNPSLFARADDDQDVARDLYRRGVMGALPDIIGIVHAEAPGDVVMIDLVSRAGRWIYRFQIIRSDGHRVMVDVDATWVRSSMPTARLSETKERRGRLL